MEEVLIRLLPFVLLSTVAFAPSCSANGVDRCSFPAGFVFGTSSASYQYEGAANEGGRERSIWDKFSHTPGMISDGSNGDVASDEYHKYPEDIQIMQSMRLDAYRFSISWGRLFHGRRINPEGLAYYNALIDGLIAAGIEPYITLYHWDLPQSLDDLYGGWLNLSIVDDFAAYAEVCFEAFGDRVKNWLTFNEPYTFAIRGFSQGKHAPGRCSTCSKGNSLTEPYIVAHHVLLAHAVAVHTYRTKFQAKAGGRIGIALDCYWYEPYTNKAADVNAAARMADFKLGWFLNPIIYGEYPSTMRSYLKSRLPRFSVEESFSLRGSLDFLGLNYYSSRYIQDAFGLNNITDAEGDPQALELTARNGSDIGKRGTSKWLYVTPWGLEKVLKYIRDKYQKPNIIITENGIDEPNDPSLTLEQALSDKHRIQFYSDHLRYLRAAIRDGVNVTGFFAWSLLDNFEWEIGYSVRFGLCFVDFTNEQKRYLKDSALWFRHILGCQGSTENIASL